MKYIYLIILTTLLMSCTQKQRVEKSNWKYADGYHIGDVLDFNIPEAYIIDDNGNITAFGKDVATVQNLSLTGKQLTILSLSGEQGTYVKL